VGGGSHPKTPIPRILARYHLHMQMIGGGGGEKVLVEIDMHIGVACGLVGEINWREEGFTLNGRYRAYSLDIACPCKLLAVAVKVVC
jgi:hypothetical protein